MADISYKTVRDRLGRWWQRLRHGRGKQQPKHDAKQPRVLAKQSYRSFHLSKPLRRPAHQKLPSSWRLLRAAFGLLGERKGFFIGVSSVIAVLQLVLVTGVIASSATEIRDLLREASTSVWETIFSSVTLTTYLASSTGQASTEQASVYQMVLLLIGSLALIWGLRYVESSRGSKLRRSEKLRIRDAYYNGMAPLVQFVLVLLVVLVQFVPLAVGSWLFSVVVQGGIAVNFIEQALWVVFLSGFGVLTLYMVLSSVFALVIVTLPGVTPMQALRSSRGLVLHRRLSLLRKFVVFLLIALPIFALIIMPIAYFLPRLAPWFVYVLFIGMFVISYAYLYVIYRELLRRDE